MFVGDFCSVMCYNLFVVSYLFSFFFFFFKQKTAYEIYQCDWSSDVCSSDLEVLRGSAFEPKYKLLVAVDVSGSCTSAWPTLGGDRKSVV